MHRMDAARRRLRPKPVILLRAWSHAGRRRSAKSGELALRLAPLISCASLRRPKWCPDGKNSSFFGAENEPFWPLSGGFEADCADLARENPGRLRNSGF